jgi:glycosyltransferase involved in cell wall biosynthesis
MPPRVTVVVLAYNEAENLEAVVREIHAELARLAGGHEILIVDDGSGDGTGPLADRLAEELTGVRTLHHAANGGLGAVYRTGFQEARGDYVTFFPADGQFPADIIGQFVPLMADADLVLGWFEQKTEPLLARVLSLCERILYTLLFGYFPRFRGILMLRRELLARTPLVSQGRGWVVLIEFILKAARAGARIKNATTAIRPRMSGVSKVRNLRTIVANVRQVIGLRRHL